MCKCVHIKAMFNHMPLQTALAMNPQPAGLRKKEARKEEEREMWRLMQIINNMGDECKGVQREIHY